MDIWVLGDPELSTLDHLLRLVSDILKTAVPDKAWVYSDSPHHYTEGGIEVNVLNDGTPVEVLECGRIAASLLERLKIDPQRHGGLALGMGLDRLTMLRKGIPDVRLLRDQNVRVQAQMHDLNPWSAVSRLPSITQENVLLRVVLRDCSRSITTHEANALYANIQSALHEGAPGAGYRMDLPKT
jgi:phenylalanyl-tRNA synthetase alpha chain